MSECNCSGQGYKDFDMHSENCPVYMRGRIAQLENPWVSVEDRLPEPERNFLGFGHYGYDVLMYSTNPFNSNQLPTWDKLRVTHWMPLPEPPK